MLGEFRPRAVTGAGGIDVDRTDVAAGAMPRDGAAGSPSLPAGGVWRDPVTWVIALLVLAGYFTISLFRLLRLTPSSYDFGIYVEYVKQLSQLHAPVVDILGPGFNLLGNHFQIALAVLAPLYRVAPSPATLLFCQAALTAASVFPVSAAGSALAGRATGRLIGFGYAFSWGLQQMVNDDFHEIALAVPLLAFALSALVRRRPAAAIGWALPLVFVKEDQGFTVAAIGLLLGLSVAFPRIAPGGWRARVPFRAPGFGPGGRYRGDSLEDRLDDRYVALWGGLLLFAWGLFWSLLAVKVIIPHFNPSHDYYFWKDGGVVGGHPFSVTAILTQTAHDWPVKLETVGLLLLPTAFTALGSPVALLAVPILALRFMSTNTMFWGTGWHYNATLMPILFIAAADALGRWGRSPGPVWPTAGEPGAVPGAPLGAWAVASARAARSTLARSGGVLIAVATVALAIHFPVSGLWRASTYRLGAHVAAANAAMAVVPDGATVQTNLDLLAPLAARTDTFWLGTPGNPLTQYVVFDNDNSGYNVRITNVSAFIAMLYPNDGYVQVFERDGVYVYRRGG